MCSSRIYFRHVCMLDDPQHLAQACVAHTVSLLTRTLPEVVWKVRTLLAARPVSLARRSLVRRRAQVELVTEGLPFWEPPSAVHVLAVPAEYMPAKGSQGRARAQQYAAEHSEAAPGDWVVHLGAASVLRERTVCARASGRMRMESSHHPFPRRRWMPSWRTWLTRRSACPPRAAAASGTWRSTAASRRHDT